jgi:hypothetical protein
MGRGVGDEGGGDETVMMVSGFLDEGFSSFGHVYGSCVVAVVVSVFVSRPFFFLSIHSDSGVWDLGFGLVSIMEWACKW